ncbi:inner nuclear membrane protein enriched at telomere/subtelomere region [Ophidiomyces ophidiicola]|nr:inner nuclear membrane protein enriched at telomere/subtelomere region [Ophidiomyces ophidiicola]
MSTYDSGDELAYLTPGFDLNSLTVPRLRSILVTHDISYPTSAKKAQLVNIIESEVLPKAKQLLRQRDRIQRTSVGIIDMPSSQESIEEDDNTASHPPPATPSTRKGRSRPSTRASTADIGDGIPPPSTDRRRTTRYSSKHARASDTEETGEDTNAVEATPKATGRKLRKSEAYPTPHASVAPIDETTPVSIKRESRDASVFSDENPFQSGSPSVASGVRSVSSEVKRKGPRHSTPAALSTDERRRRKAETPPSSVSKRGDRGFVVPTSSTFEAPITGLKSLGADGLENDDLVAGEEFTPDEQLAMMQAQATPRKPSVKRQRQKQGAGSQFISWFVIASLISGVALWWRKEKVEIGYCGVGKPRWSLEATKVPEWANVLEPKCEPCPQHAICRPSFEAVCEQDFVLKPHPLSLGGLIPLAATCEPDSDKLRRVKVVTDKAVDELREQRARYECGETEKDGSKEVASPEMTSAELKQRVSNSKRKGMSDEEFEELWRGAIGEITGREEVVTSTSPTSPSGIRFSSTSLAKLSFTCAIKRHLRLSLVAYRLPLLILAITSSFCIYIRSRILAKRSDTARIPSLVSMTLDRLATQAALHARGEALEPWISIGQLRDDVLRDELKRARREALWNGVKRIVEGNANVRASVREGRGGDVSRVWEWIGGIRAIAGGDFESPANRLDGSKVRFSLPLPSTPGEVSNETPGSRGIKKWEEGRAVY